MFLIITHILRRHRLSLKNVVYIGLRSVDPAERQIAEQHDMLLYAMEDVDRHGIVRVMDMALAQVDPEGRRGIHVSFDIDALDALEVPSTGTPGNNESHFQYAVAIHTIGNNVSLSHSQFVAACRCARACTSSSACTRPAAWRPSIWSK